MKKFILFLFPIFILILAVFNTKPTPVFAEPTAAAVSDSYDDRVGLLPISRFYFLKEWGRSVERFFTRKSIARAELELRILEEKSLEIRALKDKNIEDEGVFKKGLLGYKKARARLIEDLSEIPSTQAGAKVDALIDKIKDHLTKEIDVIGPLEARFAADPEFQEEDAGFEFEESLFGEGEGLDFEEDFSENGKELEDADDLDGLEEDLDSLNADDLIGEDEDISDAETKLEDCGRLPELAAPPQGCNYNIRCADKRWDVKLICEDGGPETEPAPN